MSRKLNFIVKASIDPEQPEALQHYLQELSLLYAAENVKRLAHYPVTHVAVGDEQPSFIAVFEFPDMATFDRIYKGESYKSLLPYRDKAFARLNVYLSEAATE